MLLAPAAPALAIFKCEAAGKTTYSDAPCPDGKQLDLSHAIAPSDAAQGTRRAMQQKAELDRIDSEHHQAEVQANKGRRQQARADARKTKQCQLIAQRKKKADQAVATAAPKSLEKARAKAYQAQDKYEAECGESSNPAQLIAR